MWRDCDQAAALAGNDVSSFHDDVDFAKLQAGVTDLSSVPVTGSTSPRRSSNVRSSRPRRASGTTPMNRNIPRSRTGKARQNVRSAT